MINNRRWLSLVLSEDLSFDELLIKIGRAFKHNLSCEDDEGRYIARAKCGVFSIEVIDKVDRLSEFLCDDNYVLEVIIDSDEYFNSDFDKDIKKILSDNLILWERAVWAPAPLPAQ